MENCQLYLLFGIAQTVGLVGLGLLLHYIGKHESISWNTHSRFVFHPILMVFGLVYLSGTAITSFRVIRCVDKLHVKAIHTLTHVVVFSVMVIGLIPTYSRLSDNIDHFNTIHTWVGSGIVIFFSVQLLLGFLCFLFLKDSILRQAAMPWHRYVGVSLFLLSTTTALMGVYQEDLQSTDRFEINWCGLLLAAYNGLITFIVMNDQFKTM